MDGRSPSGAAQWLYKRRSRLTMAMQRTGHIAGCVFANDAGPAADR
jgi:hypothetical protein